jgi:hypothetical protein
MTTTPMCICQCHGISGRWAVCSIEGGCGHLHHPNQTSPIRSGRCQLDGHPTRPGSRLCWTHHETLTQMLNPDNDGDPERDIPACIPTLWDTLDPTPGGGNTERRAPGFRSTPPASLHVLVMRDDRSVNDPQEWHPVGPNGKPDTTKTHTEETSPPRSIRKALEGLLDAVIEADEPVGPRLASGRFVTARSVLDCCASLYARVELLTASEDAAETFRDVAELSDQLRRAAGDAPLGPDGWCLALVRDQRYAGYRECRGPLTLLPPTPDPPDETREEAQRKTVAICPRCYRRYTWLDMVRVRLARETA